MRNVNAHFRNANFAHECDHREKYVPTTNTHMYLLDNARGEGRSVLGRVNRSACAEHALFRCAAGPHVFECYRFVSQCVRLCSKTAPRMRACGVLCTAYDLWAPCLTHTLTQKTVSAVCVCVCLRLCDQDVLYAFATGHNTPATSLSHKHSRTPYPPPSRCCVNRRRRRRSLSAHACSSDERTV